MVSPRWLTAIVGEKPRDVLVNPALIAYAEVKRDRAGNLKADQYYLYFSGVPWTLTIQGDISEIYSLFEPVDPANPKC